jgi:Kinesin motor domain
MLQNKFKEE